MTKITDDRRSSEFRGDWRAAFHHEAQQWCGWTWVSDHSCPRKLTGKRCRGDGCWCRHRGNDHGNTWDSDTRRRFVLWEPYGPLSPDNHPVYFSQLRRKSACRNFPADN